MIGRNDCFNTLFSQLKFLEGAAATSVFGDIDWCSSSGTDVLGGPWQDYDIAGLTILTARSLFGLLDRSKSFFLPGSLAHPSGQLLAVAFRKFASYQEETKMTPLTSHISPHPFPSSFIF